MCTLFPPCTNMEWILIYVWVHTRYTQTCSCTHYTHTHYTHELHTHTCYGLCSPPSQVFSSSQRRSDDLDTRGQNSVCVYACQCVSCVCARQCVSCVCVCVCVCLCVCMSVFVLCACLCLCVCMSVFILCACLCLCVCMSVCVLCVCLCVCMLVCVLCVCVCVSVYWYVYIKMCVYTCLYNLFVSIHTCFDTLNTWVCLW